MAKKTKEIIALVFQVEDGGELTSVKGFRAAATHAGLKSDPRKPDVALLYCERADCAATGVFTRNRIAAAPVGLCKRHLQLGKGRAQAVIVNAGCANACTGRQGLENARLTAKRVARELQLAPEKVLVCSTGVIGRQLPMDVMEKGIAFTTSAVKRRIRTGSFSQAILTTDLVEKTASLSFCLAGKSVKIVGTCKGSGMIAPNMATMLAFLATDVAIAPAVLQTALRSASDDTFNCLTVDGDTSTNDTVLALASGAAGNKPIRSASGNDYDAFRSALRAVCETLAEKVAADGEGATHAVTIFVGGTETDAEAGRIAKTIAESPLVKTAVAGNDPNWGRIVAAAGRAGVAFKPEQASLTVCGTDLWRGGTPLPFDRAAVAKALKNKKVSIVFLAGDGPGRARFLTCDLTHGYITINADYHT